MEKIGACYEPVNQVVNIQLVPFTSGVGEDKFYTHNREQGHTCAGSLHGNFSNNSDGNRFSASWRESDNGLYNGEIQSELQAVIYALRQNLFKDRDSMLAYCQSHPEAKLSDGKISGGEEYASYGFKLETESRQYFVNCFTQGRGSQFSVFAYAEKPTPILTWGWHPQEQASDRATSSTANDRPSVLDEIRESRSTPKRPAKSERDNKKKSQPEH